MRLKFIAAFLALAACACAPAVAAPRDKNILEARLAGERIVLAPRYVQPVASGACMAGDSRTDTGGGGHPTGVSWLTNQFFAAVNQGTDYQSVLTSLTNNIVRLPYSYARGVGGSTTLGLLDRIAVASNAQSGNPAFATSSIGTDAYFDYYSPPATSTLSYSLMSDPNCNVVFVMVGTNNPGLDYGHSGMSTAQSLQQLAGVLDALGTRGGTLNTGTAGTYVGTLKSGANKIVMLADETPRGLSVPWSETHAFVTPGTITANNSGSAFYSYNGNGYIATPVIVSSGGVNTVYTYTASAPGTHQFSVTSTGVYSFYSGDFGTGKTVQLMYAYYSYQLAGGALTELLDIHGWLASSAGNYVGYSSSGVAGAGFNYGIPGALYGRPWVKSLPTWEATVDSTSGTLFLNKAGLMADGIHPNDGGQRAVASVVAPVLQSLFGTSPIFTYPKYNNPTLAVGNSSLKTFSGTLPTETLAQVTAYHGANGYGGVTFNGPNSGSGTLTEKSDGSGALLNGGAVTSPASSINYTTGAWTVTFPNNVYSTWPVSLKLDPTQLQYNGQFDPAFQAGAAGTPISANASSCGNSNIPAPWSVGLPAGVTANLTSGALVMTCGWGVAPDGNNGFYLSFQGMVGSSSTVNIGLNLVNGLSILSVPNKYRAYARVTYQAGPGGHLYGFTPPELTLMLNNTTGGNVLGVQCTNGANTCTQFKSAIGPGNITTTIPVTPDNLPDFGGTAVHWDLLTPPTPTSGDAGAGALTASGSVLETIYVTLVANTMVDGKIWFQNSAIRQSAN